MPGRFAGCAQGYVPHGLKRFFQTTKMAASAQAVPPF